MLSDVTNKPENLRYSNVDECFSKLESGCSVENQPNFENSDMEFSDQDPTYTVPKQKKLKPVYPSHPSRLSSSSSSSTSSCSSSSDSSSDSSDSDQEPCSTQHKEQTNLNQGQTTDTFGDNQMQVNIDEPSTSEESRIQELREVSAAGEDTREEIDKDKKGRKRKRNEKYWKQNRAKTLRNTGKEYITKKNKIAEPRNVKPPCTDKCRIKCFEKITADQRQAIFDVFWNLGETHQQRSFIMSCMTDIKPRYKYTNAEHPRKCNQAFHFLVDGKSIRVCKMFFMRTLDISDRVIRTVKSKIDAHGVLVNDLRGKHSNHAKVDETIISDMKKFIEAIPRIESHYTRQTSTREYIDGGKTISDIFRDFQETQNKNNRPSGKYCTFYKVFTQDYNISFFQPRKDQCDLCLQYLNSSAEQKISIQKSYDAHLEEKLLSRQEKYADRLKIDDKYKVLVFDLQAVLQSPKGDTSAFFYKSKLNSYNFTVSFLNKKVEGQIKDAYDDVHCFFWNETDAKRGANEIGSCLLKIFEKISSESADDGGVHLVLYSDNCCGQNKNKFMVALYLYVVTHLNIESITHKFLIKGHTQNEGDNIHSLIEKEIKKNLKSGPIYSPHQYVAIIKNAKKTGKKFWVHELTFESFLDMKKLQEDWGSNFNKTTDGRTVVWNDLKVIKVVKSSPFSFFVKNSYKDEEYQEVCIRNKRKKLVPLSDLKPVPAYTGKQDLGENKKKDLRELIAKQLIPNFYSDFYDSIL